MLATALLYRSHSCFILSKLQHKTENIHTHTISMKHYTAELCQCTHTYIHVHIHCTYSLLLYMYMHQYIVHCTCTGTCIGTCILQVNVTYYVQIYNNQGGSIVLWSICTTTKATGKGTGKVLLWLLASASTSKEIGTDQECTHGVSGRYITMAEWIHTYMYMYICICWDIHVRTHIHNLYAHSHVHVHSYIHTHTCTW